MWKWRWDKPLEGTSMFPHHRRWSCREAMIGALRWRAVPAEAAWWLGRAMAFNLVMYDCGDPLAYRYLLRIRKIDAICKAERERLGVQGRP